MLKVVTVDFHDSTLWKNIAFTGSETFLDADILVVNPSIIPQIWKDSVQLSNGEYYFTSQQGSDKLRAILLHRADEIRQLLGSGKLVVVLLDQIRAIRGEVNFGGHLPITNYDWLPYPQEFLLPYFCNGIGTEHKLINQSHPFSPYYNAFRSSMAYKMYLKVNIEKKDLISVNNTGNPIAWSASGRGGLIVFLPSLEHYDEKKFFGVLIQCSNNYFRKEVKTPEPEWACKFILPGELTLQERIDGMQKEIDRFTEEKTKIEKKKLEITKFRLLLYETGPQLESSVIKAFQLMGFEAEGLKKDDFEHDIILVSPEGRAIGEIEGKDKDAISIEKLDQLSRVVDEDFSRNEKYPEGLLIGNPYRLLIPEKRGDPFTEKVKIAAGRKQFKLLTTLELFLAIVKILEDPSDEDYKTKCREKIFEDSILDIVFPKQRENESR